jgi:hypothetical protein
MKNQQNKKVCQGRYKRKAQKTPNYNNVNSPVVALYHEKENSIDETLNKVDFMKNLRKTETVGMKKLIAGNAVKLQKLL